MIKILTKFRQKEEFDSLRVAVLQITVVAERNNFKFIF